MNELKKLEQELLELQKKSGDLNTKVFEHLKEIFDHKLDTYEDFDDFLCDVNNYAGDTYGKLLYINHAKNIFNK